MLLFRKMIEGIEKTLCNRGLESAFLEKMGWNSCGQVFRLFCLLFDGARLNAFYGASGPFGGPVQ